MSVWGYQPPTVWLSSRLSLPRQRFLEVVMSKLPKSYGLSTLVDPHQSDNTVPCLPTPTVKLETLPEDIRYTLSDIRYTLIFTDLIRSRFEEGSLAFDAAEDESHVVDALNSCDSNIYTLHLRISALSQELILAGERFSHGGIEAASGHAAALEYFRLFRQRFDLLVRMALDRITPSSLDGYLPAGVLRDGGWVRVVKMAREPEYVNFWNGLPNVHAILAATEREATKLTVARTHSSAGAASSPPEAVIRAQRPPSLTRRQQMILLALQSLGATDADHRRNRDEVAELIAVNLSGQHLGAPISQLKKLGYTDSHGGPDGGVWLTLAGIQKAAELAGNTKVNI